MAEYFSSTLQILEQYGVRKAIKAGHILQYQEELVKNIFVVLEGKASAHVFESNGKEICMDTYSQGDLIGLEHLRHLGPSSCQISAQSPMKILQFRHQIFMELLEVHDQVGHYVFEQFSLRLRKFQEGHIESQILTKRGRVASEIRRLAAPDTRSTNAYIVTPKPVISDIAARLGIARETVSRTVSDLIKDQILERNLDAFYVPDLTRLEAEMR